VLVQLVEALCYKVMGLIPDEVTGCLRLTILPAALEPGVDSAADENERQESSWG
jgi:hypothetical protein